eukprot:scaffold32354_cov22-Tisochrysis_lutea.AAC.1
MAKASSVLDLDGRFLRGNPQADTNLQAIDEVDYRAGSLPIMGFLSGSHRRRLALHYRQLCAPHMCPLPG